MWIYLSLPDAFRKPVLSSCGQSGGLRIGIQDVAAIMRSRGCADQPQCGSTPGFVGYPGLLDRWAGRRPRVEEARALGNSQIRGAGAA